MNDITSYLYTQKLGNAILNPAGSVSAAAKTGGNVAENAEFAKLLSENITKLTQMSELSDALDKTVLGNYDATALSALSEELLNTSSGREVIAKLSEGQLNAIVLTDDDDEDDNDDSGISNTINSLTDVMAQTTEVSDIVKEALQTANLKSN